MFPRRQICLTQNLDHPERQSQFCLTLHFLFSGTFGLRSCSNVCGAQVWANFVIVLKSVNRLLRALRLAAVLIALAVSFDCAATLTWIGGVGDWSVAGNWDGGRVPGIGDVAVVNSGIVTADWESTIAGLTITGGRLQGVGQIRVTGNFTWTGGSMGSSFGFGEIIVDAGGTATFAGPADKDLGRRVENHGALTWTEGRLLFSNGTLVNAGVMTIAHDASLAAGAGMKGTFQNTGTLYKASSGEMVLDGVIFQQTGTLNATGTIRSSSGALDMHGTLNAGLGVGRLDVEGDLSQGADGTTRFEFAGFDSYDAMRIAGTATLHGAVKVELLNGFVPPEGIRFLVMQFGARVGSFDSMMGLNLPNGLFLQPILTETNFSFKVTAKPQPAFTDCRVDKTNGAAGFTISSVAGQTFVLEARDGLDASAEWAEVLTNGDSSLIYDFIDGDRAKHAARFFRVKVASP